MRNSNNICSNEEYELIDLLSRYGFMSFYQAAYILENYGTCRNIKQAQAVVYSLARNRMATWMNGHQYIVSTANSSSEFVNMDIIKALAMIIDTCDGMRDIQSSIIFNEPYRTLSYTVNRKLFHIAVMPDIDFIPYIMMNQQIYTQQKTQMDASNFNSEEFSYLTYFIFNSSANQDYVLDAISALNLTMPHEICFINEEELIGNITFTKYTCE